MDADGEKKAVIISLKQYRSLWEDFYDTLLAHEEDGRWSAWIEALPGCAAWGYTQEEALTAIQDAMEA